MDIFIGVVVGLVVLMLLVTAHEFGHFLAARRNGVRVLEFGIGFPPRVIAWKKENGKWRRLPKSEWDQGGVNKTVGVEKDKKTGNTKTTKSSVVSKAKAVKNGETSKKIVENGLVFSLNWLPIGGFCQMDGESAVDERAGTFGNANFWQKTKILFAGVGMNWLVAFIIFTILAWVGMPQFLDSQFTVEADTRTDFVPVRVAEVLSGSPAEDVGIQANDYFIAVDGQKYIYASEFTDYNASHAGEEVVYTILRTETPDTKIQCSHIPCSDEDLVGSTMDVAVTLNSSDAEYLMGVRMESTQTLSYSTWSAPIVGAGLTLQLTGQTFYGVGQLLWNLVTGVGSQLSFDDGVRESGQAALSDVGDSVSGPVGIVGSLFPAFTAAGPSNLAFLAALISVSLACMNVLPIPALDGGRWMLIGWYKLRRKTLTKEVEEKIVSRAMIVLLALIFIVTILDITRFFR